MAVRLPIPITAFDLASRFIGLTELKGLTQDHPQILAMLRLDAEWPAHDEVPWCSAFHNYVCWLLRLPRSKSLLARSWLNVGVSIMLDEAQVGFDTVVLARGGGNQPGPEDVEAPGHVGWYAGHTDDLIEILGGNQSNMVSVARYPRSRLLGVRRV